MTGSKSKKRSTKKRCVWEELILPLGLDPSYIFALKGTFLKNEMMVIVDTVVCKCPYLAKLGSWHLWLVLPQKKIFFFFGNFMGR